MLGWTGEEMRSVEETWLVCLATEQSWDLKSRGGIKGSMLW